jgi:hypothetical protein
MAKERPLDSAAAQRPRIYRAIAPHSSDGAVFWEEPEIDIAAAVAHRLSGGDVVVRGNDKDENRKLAQEIEEGVGPWQLDKAHTITAGDLALPHYHQVSDPDKRRNPPGHTFYEVTKTKARKKKQV